MPRSAEASDAISAAAYSAVPIPTFPAAAPLTPAEPSGGSGCDLTVEEGCILQGYTCVLHSECASPHAELERFKRTVAFAGKFAHSMHKQVGAPVRGVQGVQMRKGQA